MLGCPRDHLKQLTDTRWLKGLQHWWLLKLKLGCGRNSGRLWRRTFGWPQGCPGKPFEDSEKESMDLPRLCLTWMENC